MCTFRVRVKLNVLEIIIGKLFYIYKKLYILNITTTIVHMTKQTTKKQVRTNYIRTLDVLCFFNFQFFTARSPSKDALESTISDTHFNFALPSLWNLLFNF